jgi:predicted nucleotidyltransferase
MSNAELTNLLVILRESFKQIFGDQFERMVLFGSRARGDNREDSDIDILVVLHDKFEYAEAIRCSSELVARLSLENDVTISRSFVSHDEFEQGQSPFLLNVRREGVLL